MARYLFVAIGLLVGLALAGVFVLGTRQSETELWESIQNSKDSAKFISYLKEYPEGNFADRAKSRLATLRREEVERTKAARRNELMELEREDPQGFWATVTPRDAVLLVSDTLPGNWPVFTVKDWGTGYSRLHLAAVLGRHEVVRMLLERGADVNARNRWQETPLHDAAWQGHDEVVGVLLEKGADIHARDQWQETPLHDAAWQGHDEVVGVLLERGADIHARDQWQETPLHGAARNGREQVVGLLLGGGADIGARNSKGRTALDIAKQFGDTGVDALLRAKQGDAVRR